MKFLFSAFLQLPNFLILYFPSSLSEARPKMKQNPYAYMYILFFIRMYGCVQRDWTPLCRMVAWPNISENLFKLSFLRKIRPSDRSAHLPCKDETEIFLQARQFSTSPKGAAIYLGQNFNADKLWFFSNMKVAIINVQ